MEDSPERKEPVPVSYEKITLEEAEASPFLKCAIDSFFRDSYELRGKSLNNQEFSDGSFFAEAFSIKLSYYHQVADFFWTEIQTILNEPAMKNAEFEGKKFSNMDYSETLDAGTSIADEITQTMCANIIDLSDTVAAKMKSNTPVQPMTERPITVLPSAQNFSITAGRLQTFTDFCTNSLARLKEHTDEASMDSHLRKLNSLNSNHTSPAEVLKIQEQKHFFGDKTIRTEHGSFLYCLYPELLRKNAETQNPKINEVIAMMQYLASYQYLRPFKDS